MDPSKRMCIKNLPPDVTKKDLADLIRKRTRAQPQYIDLGLLEDGTPRRYAHVTVEGLKGVMEAINGVDIRGFNVIVEQAKPHYSFALAEARRKREREEREAEETLEKRAEELRERWNSLPDTITKEKPPKSFFHNKQRYATVASQIAKQSREKHRQAYGNSVMPPSTKNMNHYFPEDAENNRKAAAAAAATSAAPGGDSKFARKKEFLKDKRKPKPVPEPAAPAPPPEPPQPTKEEKKLSGLQARLAALREKMKAK
ncbi:Hypothetical protein, putative [Bodo saltans]|uniref:RRM domain-containing protein n=1 Tax=Bodo saltans TaxID=75058 RepID=A0A0S4JT72_BODSA|nr:Hypothetical protein, putative [Bodo saltans]|eukprot:CUG93396.1 Hypothetical protein, putative [Bodo saltans]